MCFESFEKATIYFDSLEDEESDDDDDDDVSLDDDDEEEDDDDGLRDFFFKRLFRRLSVTSWQRLRISAVNSAVMKPK